MSKNNIVVPQAKDALERFKMEAASEDIDTIVDYLKELEYKSVFIDADNKKNFMILNITIFHHGT